MPTKIILNTTPQIEIKPNGSFITTKASNRDLADKVQWFARFEPQVPDSIGAIIDIGDVGVAIEGAQMAALLASPVDASKNLGVNIRDILINFIVDNGLIDGTAA